MSVYVWHVDILHPKTLDLLGWRCVHVVFLTFVTIRTTHLDHQCCMMTREPSTCRLTGKRNGFGTQCGPARAIDCESIRPGLTNIEVSNMIIMQINN